MHMSRGRFVPADFTITPELRAWAAQNAPAVDLERATDYFRDHEFARPRSNWEATWRNWMRKAQDGMGPYKGGVRLAQGPSQREASQRQSDELFAQLEAAEARKRARLQIVK